MKFILRKGTVYRLNETNYRELMRLLAAKKLYDMGKLAVVSVNMITHDITNMTPEEAMKIYVNLPETKVLLAHQRLFFSRKDG